MSEELNTAVAAPAIAAPETAAPANVETTTDGWGTMENALKNSLGAVPTASETPQEVSKPDDEHVPSGSDSADEKSGAEGADQGEPSEQAAGPAVWQPSESELALAESYGITKERLQEFALGPSAALNAALSEYDKQFSQKGREWLSGQRPAPEPVAPPPIPLANPKEDEFSDEFGGDDADQTVIKERDHYKAAYESLMAQQQRAQVEQRAQETQQREQQRIEAEEAVDVVFQEASDLKELFGEGPRGKLSKPSHISARREVLDEMIAITAGLVQMDRKPLTTKETFQRALYSVYGPQLQRKAAESAAADAKRAVTDSIKQQARDNVGRFIQKPASQEKPVESGWKKVEQVLANNWPKE